MGFYTAVSLSIVFQIMCKKRTEFIIFLILLKTFAFALLMLKICRALKHMSRRRINNLTNLYMVYFPWHTVEI